MGRVIQKWNPPGFIPPSLWERILGRAPQAHAIRAAKIFLLKIFRSDYATGARSCFIYACGGNHKMTGFSIEQSASPSRVIIDKYLQQKNLGQREVAMPCGRSSRIIFPKVTEGHKSVADPDF